MQRPTVTECLYLDQQPPKKFRETPNQMDNVLEGPTTLEMSEEIFPAKWMESEYRLGLVNSHSPVLLAAWATQICQVVAATWPQGNSDHQSER